MEPKEYALWIGWAASQGLEAEEARTALELRNLEVTYDWTLPLQVVHPGVSRRYGLNPRNPIASKKKS